MQSEIFAQMLRFGVVGVIGFIIDGVLLWFFLSRGLNPYLARTLSFPVAVAATWAINRNWTFAATRHAKPDGQFRRYFAVQLVGTFANFGAYSLILETFGTQWQTVVVGFSIGSFLGAFLNFFGARHIAFRG